MAVESENQSKRRAGSKTRRRRRGSGRKRKTANGAESQPAKPPVDGEPDKAAPPGGESKPVTATRTRRGRRRGAKKRASESASAASKAAGEAPAPKAGPEQKPPATRSAQPKAKRKKKAPRKAQAEVAAGLPAAKIEPAATREKPRDEEGPGPRRQEQKKSAPAMPQRARETDTAAPTRVVSAEKARRTMIVNVTGSDECRIAILHEGKFEELFIERQSAESHVGNLYKGRVTNVEPSIQAAFVDFGLPKNGFLHVSDIQPQYFPGGGKTESVGKKVPRRDRPPIQKCLRRGEEVIVQITKEGVGTKGPTLTTYLSIPGRFLVMLPGMDRLGVSRKIEDDDARRTMRELLGELRLPPGMGFILRTAGLDRTKRELQRDLNYLDRLWKRVSDRIKKTDPPAELYQESDLVIRTLRDVYTPDFGRVVIDDAATAEKARDFLRIAAPRSPNVVELYEKPEPIFHAFGIEEQIELIHSRHVPLQSGGSLVIDTTEAMVTIDVNSGKFREGEDAEEAAFKIDMEAAEEIARQLRLRDLGGLIVCDFIDLRYDRHRRAVERTLREALRKHKERARILRMSQFGLIEMTRQRQRPSIKRSIYNDCPHCRGTGLIKTVESMALEVMRILQLAAHRNEVHRITLSASQEVAMTVLNQRRAALRRLEETTGKTIAIRADESFATEQIQCECTDERDRPISIEV